MVNSKQKLKDIQLVITDVDGVLTDAGIYYDKNGEFLKKFNTRDSFGMELLLKKNIKTIMLTRENSEIVKQRAKKIKIVDLISGVKDKKSLLPKIQKKYSVKMNEIAYIGDDLNDLEIMKSVGFCASPHDGVLQVKKISDYVCDLNGGEGAFREFSELILKYKKNQ
ncbi:MAG: 3-deoxy-D-manno-octulosonate 8-phosphate phosphatase [Euryarchaeota archaeon]|nr:3-deoxy-D-manno-octulosonate 8-phosphate phosphatase [Euryarchaeota archaeon]|tara:strand:+ start:656 stop:1153 length:498 start_codon:yes stop_codon:yes gene_type:complete